MTMYAIDVCLVEYQREKCEGGVTNEQEVIFLENLYTKAEELYDLGEFEQAMVLYSRGICIKPRMESFKEGFRKAQLAITNIIGKKINVHVTEDTDSNIHDADLQLDSLKKSNNLSLKELRKVVLLEEEHTQETVDDINKCIDESKNSWKSECPFYKQIKEKTQDLEGGVERTDTEMKQGRKVLQDENEKTKLLLKEKLERLACMLAENRNNKAEGLGLEIIQLLDSTNTDVLPNKLQYYVLIFNFMVLIYIRRHRYNMAKKYSKLFLDVALQTGEQCNLCLTYGIIGKMNAAFGKHVWAIETWGKMLPLTQDQHLLAWIFHEMGRCYFELNEIETAHTYGKWSYQSALSISDNCWLQNSLILIAHCEIHLGDTKAAKKAYEEARKYVTDFTVSNYIQRCMDLIDDSTETHTMRIDKECQPRSQLRMSRSSHFYSNKEKKRPKRKENKVIKEGATGLTVEKKSILDDSSLREVHFESIFGEKDNNCTYITNENFVETIATYHNEGDQNVGTAECKPSLSSKSFRRNFCRSPRNKRKRKGVKVNNISRNTRSNVPRTGKRNCMSKFNVRNQKLAIKKSTMHIPERNNINQQNNENYRNKSYVNTGKPLTLLKEKAKNVSFPKISAKHQFDNRTRKSISLDNIKKLDIGNSTHIWKRKAPTSVVKKVKRENIFSRAKNETKKALSSVNIGKGEIQNFFGLQNINSRSKPNTQKELNKKNPSTNKVINTTPLYIDRLIDVQRKEVFTNQDSQKVSLFSDKEFSRNKFAVVKEETDVSPYATQDKIKDKYSKSVNVKKKINNNFGSELK